MGRKPVEASQLNLKAVKRSYDKGVKIDLICKEFQISKATFKRLRSRNNWIKRNEFVDQSFRLKSNKSVTEFEKNFQF